MTRLYQRLKTMLIADGLIATVSLEVRLAISAYLLRKPNMGAALHAARLTPADEDTSCDSPIWTRTIVACTYTELQTLTRAMHALGWTAASSLRRMTIRRAPAFTFCEAARLDRRMLPAWALADLSFRQGNIRAFIFEHINIASTQAGTQVWKRLQHDNFHRADLTRVAERLR